MRISLMTAAALLAAPLFAQAPANDDCANAIPVNLGNNGTFTNVGATTLGPAWTCALGNAGVWFSYVANCNGQVSASTCGFADYDTAMDVYDGSCGALNLIQCVDDFCGLQTQVTWTATPGTTYYIRVGGFNNAQGNFDLDLSCDLGFEMNATVEQTPGAGTLGTADALFTDGDILRWNYGDANGNFAFFPAATVLNTGVGGPPAVGVTALIPGFNQLWAGSTPSGLETIYGPFLVGLGDQSVTVPAGLFGAGDTVRIQALVLDAANAPGTLPVVPSSNSILFTYQAPPPSCVISEDFEGIATGVGSYPTGWANGAGTQQWSANSGGTTSNPTGPTSARSGNQYMYTETSSPVAVGDVFEMVSDTYTDQTVTNLNFYLSRFGSDIGQLDIFLDDGTTLTPLGSYTGPDANQSQGGNEWSLETLALPSPLPASYNILFRYTTLPVVQFTFYGDCAIDLFCLN